MDWDSEAISESELWSLGCDDEKIVLCRTAQGSKVGSFVQRQGLDRVIFFFPINSKRRSAFEFVSSFGAQSFPTQS